MTKRGGRESAGVQSDCKIPGPGTTDSKPSEPGGAAIPAAPCCSHAVYHANPSGSAPYWTCEKDDLIRDLRAELAYMASKRQEDYERFHRVVGERDALKARIAGLEADEYLLQICADLRKSGLTESSMWPGILALIRHVDGSEHQGAVK